MASLLTFLNLVLTLITELVKRHKETKRDEQEQLIQENPREFFNQGNSPSDSDGSSDSVHNDTKH